MKTIRRQTLLAAALVGALAFIAAVGQAVGQTADQVIAIDVLLEPDATMLKHAEANNARLLKVYPKGFALDAAHRPHITLIQRFVRTADLDKAYAAAGKVFADANVTGMKLEAFKYYYAASQDVGVAGIVARPTPELLKLQADLISAVAPFTMETGTMAAFTASHDDPALDAFLIQYVSTFVPKQTGEHFNPHVSTGVALREYLDKMLAEPFEPFTFSPAGAAVFQLGPYGTAAKKLKEWRLEPALPASAHDPLPSWNDGKAKQAIVDFVAKVTREGSPDFVPPAERIAVFDNDGTLWAEQPIYFQFAFAFDRVKALAPQHPEWKRKKPFASLLKGDLKGALAGGEPAVLQILAATHAGMTTEEFRQTVSDWLATAKHPKTGRPYTEMVYQPMLELLAYLRANGFKTFIVSGGGVDFMRVFSERVYGIQPEQVVGSSGKVKFELRGGKPVLVKLPEIHHFDDKTGKPVGIHHLIGRRPIAAFGNSDGDLQMLQWTCLADGARFCLYVHHTDAEREWAYDRKSGIGRLDKGLDEAKAKGWTVVNMKDDWKTVFPPETK